MYRIGGNVSILSAEADFNDNQVVDVLEIIPDDFFGMLRVPILDDQVSGSTDSYLISNMPRQDELTIIPANLSLRVVSKIVFL